MVYTLIGDWGSWAYPVYKYEIVDPAPRFLTAATRGDNEPAFQWAQVPGGAFVAVGLDRSESPPQTRTCEPVKELNELLASATSTDTTDQDSLLRFVNRWGLLGLAEPRNAVQFYDSVMYSIDWFGQVQRLARMFEALRKRQWTSDALPSIEAIRRTIADVPGDLSQPERIRVYWQYFGDQLTQRLEAVSLSPSLAPDSAATPASWRSGSGLRPTWRPRPLADVPYIAMWQRADNADTVPRRCPTCAGMFFVGAQNTRKKYCSKAHKNLGCVRKWRKDQARQPKKGARR